LRVALKLNHIFRPVKPLLPPFFHTCVHAAGGGGRALQAGDNVTFVMAVQTSAAWVAMGLSRDGTGMKGMDVALLRREEVGIQY
jgi:hypothetical protein